MTIDDIFDAQQEHFLAQGKTTVEQRLKLLRKLEKEITRRREDIKSALYKDHKKSPEEVDLVDIMPVLREIREVKRNIRNWMEPRRVSTPLLLFGSTSKVIKQSKGVVLIISPWNFPVNLSFVPLVSAIAAGNCAIIKPSEKTPHIRLVIKEIVEAVFKVEEVAVIMGDGLVAEYLTYKPFHHIFFTGSTEIGKKVMEAAASNLASVTLELGGKSPTIVDVTADITAAARRIAMTKFIVNGQICIAPDYVLVDSLVAEPLINKIVDFTVEFYNNDARTSPHYSRVIDKKHFQRMKDLVGLARMSKERVIGGRYDDESLFMDPTVIVSKIPKGRYWDEEIFGPILPIHFYTHLDEALNFINERPRPLALYVFCKKKDKVRKILRNTRAGATVVNSATIHHYNSKLPFGGVNESGMGRSHGKWGFDEFSNTRPLITSPSKWSTLELLMPPYGKFKKWVINFAIKYL